LSAGFLTTLKLASVAAARASASSRIWGSPTTALMGLRCANRRCYVKLGLYPHSAQEDCVRALRLFIRNLLVVQVSSHPRRAFQEHDAARRMMFAAREDASIPKGYGGALLALHERKPFPNTPGEIAELAGQVKDANFRIETAEDGIHVYNREGHHVAKDAISLFARFRVGSDGPHAFYLGAEPMKAEIAWHLGKRYAQDSPLDWGCAVDRGQGAGTRLASAQ
jgi:hypothetical protein